MLYGKSLEMLCLATGCCLAISKFVKGKCKVPVYRKTGKENPPAPTEKPKISNGNICCEIFAWINEHPLISRWDSNI